MTTESTTEQSATIVATVKIVRDEYLPALSALFYMVGGSALFKRKIKELRDKFNVAYISETKAVRDMEKDIEMIKRELQRLYKKEQNEAVLTSIQYNEEQLEAKTSAYERAIEELMEKEIKIEAEKLESKLVPGDKVLMTMFSESYTDAYGRANSRQSDYTTQIIRIEELIEYPEA